MARQVILHEVGPRDGFQNIKKIIPTDIKKEIITRLLDAGVLDIQLTSFVSPKAIPQMADAKEIVEYFVPRYPNVNFYALVPNLFGAKAARDSGLKNIIAFLSASESHNKANVNCTVNESLDKVKSIKDEVSDLHVTMGIATAFSCPFEGETPVDKVIDLIGKGVEMGIDTFELGDTIGTAYPAQIKNHLLKIREAFPNIKVGMHIHDTRNMGMLCSWVSVESGADFIQSSIGGLGGCPFAPGASGNVSTEDLVHALNASGYDTGIDEKKIVDVAKYVRAQIEGCYSGHLINI